MHDNRNESIAPASELTAQRELDRRNKLCPSERTDTIVYDWSHIGIGIITAGAVYPLVLGALVFGTFIAVSIWNGFLFQRSGGLATVITNLLGVVTYSFFAGIFGFVWSLLVATLTLPVVYFVARTLNLRTSIVRLGAFSGGLVGFICTLPLSLQVPWHTFPSDIWAIVLFLIGGPGLATVIGQIGGARGGSRSRAARPVANRFSFRLVTKAAPQSPTADPVDSFEQAKPHFQFGIRHLLWVSVWISLLLALIRLCHIPYELMLPLLFGWITFQTATLGIGGRLARRLGPWWSQRRQSRST